MDINAAEIARGILFSFIPLLFALCVHEWAHGYMAQKLGDNTATLMGRVTLNPAAHADLLGTIILPLLGIFTNGPMFGWAKPVPVNPRNLANPKRDMFWIAFAGPLSNVAQAFVGAFLIALFVALSSSGSSQSEVVTFLSVFIRINLVLALFNMIPFHPLDGGKVIARFLPIRANDWLEANSSMIQIGLLVLFFTGFFKYFLFPALFVGNVMIGYALQLGSGLQ